MRLFRRFFSVLTVHTIRRKFSLSSTGDGIRVSSALRSRFSSLQHSLFLPHFTHESILSLAADVTLFLEDAVASGQLTAAVSLLEAASEAEFSATLIDATLQEFKTSPILVTPYHLKRLLSAAAFQQDSRISLVISDRLVALALKSPTRRVDSGVIETYASLVGGLQSGPDHVRGFAFCSLMESSGMRSSSGSSPFACYAAAVASCHGPSGMKACIRYAAARERGSLSSEAWLALLGQGSDGWGALEKVALADVRSVFRNCLSAADFECYDKEKSLLVKSQQEEQEEIGNSLTNHTLMETRRKLRIRAHDTFAQVMASRGEVVEASAACSSAYAEGLPLLAGPSTVLNAAILRARGSYNVSERSKFVNAALEVYPSALKTGKVLSSASAQLLDLLCEDSRLQEASQVAHMALNESITSHRIEEDGNSQLFTETSFVFPIDSIALERLLSHLTSTGKSTEARALFIRMQSAFARMGPPSQRAFNLILRHYAIAHDIENTREILEQMALVGHVPDANSLSALAQLRGDMTRSTTSTEHISGHRKSQSHLWQEEEVDELVSRLCDETSTVVRSDQTVPFNEAICAYFRLRKPQKALDLAAKMPSLGLAPKADTLNTITLGLLYAGGTRVHGMDLNLVPIQWGGEYSNNNSDDRSSRRFSVHPPLHLKAGSERTDSFSCADLSGIANWLYEYRLARLLLEQRGIKENISVDDILTIALNSSHSQDGDSFSSLLNPKSMQATRAALRLLLHFKVRKSHRSEPSIFSLDPSDALSSFYKASENHSGIEKKEEEDNDDKSVGSTTDFLPFLPSLLASHFHSASGLKRHQQLKHAISSNALSNSILVNAAKVREDFINACDTMVQSALHRVSSARALQLFLTLYLTGALGGNSHGTHGFGSSTITSSNSSIHSNHSTSAANSLGFLLPSGSSSSAGSSLCSASLVSTCIPSLYALDLRGSPPDVSALFAMVALTELTSITSTSRESSLDINSKYKENGPDLLALLTGGDNTRTTVRVAYLLEKDLIKRKFSIRKHRSGFFIGDL